MKWTRKPWNGKRWTVAVRGYTPGPWKIGQVGEPTLTAALLAEAPDLLEALIKVRDWRTGCPPCCSSQEGEDEMPADIFDAMIQAIRKATGDKHE